MSDAIEQHVAKVLGRAGLSAADRLVVGLSGGVDSQVLTHALIRAAHESGGPQVWAAHVNHQLRPEADADAARVLELAAQLGAGCVIITVDVGSWDRRLGQGLEAAARAARYAALAGAAESCEACWIAVGHTLDDQVETVLLGLLRGGSLGGIAGMRERSRRSIPLDPEVKQSAALGILRPLLPFRRSEIEGYAAEHGLVPIEDSSNRSLAFRRNRIRRLVVPALDEAEPSAARAIGRLSERLQSDADFLEQAAEAAEAETVSTTAGGALLIVGRARFARLHSAIQGRVVGRSVQRLIGADPGRPRVSLERVEAVAEAIVSGAVSSTIETGAGIAAYIDYDAGALGPAANLEDLLRRAAGMPLLGSARPIAVEPGGNLDLPLDNEWRLRLWSEGGSRVSVRARRSGDRLRLAGGADVRLQDWFVNRKVPSYLRDHLPLLVIDDLVYWVGGISPPRLREPEAGVTLWIERMPPEGEAAERIEMDMDMDLDLDEGGVMDVNVDAEMDTNEEGCRQ